MSSKGQAKRGRVICSWCGNVMGEAKTDMDTHGCCLLCLTRELTRLDEMFAAVELAKEACQ